MTRERIGEPSIKWRLLSPPARSGRPAARCGGRDPSHLPARPLSGARVDRPVDVYGSDIAVAVTVVAAVVAGFRFGWEPLRQRPCRSGSSPAALLAALRHLVLLAAARATDQAPRHRGRRSIEYALLAPAIVLLFRRHGRRRPLSRPSSSPGRSRRPAWGVLMFFAIVDDPEGPRPGQREVSFLGHQDLGAFTGRGARDRLRGDRARCAPAARRSRPSSAACSA